ncbi:MAG: hypothetical protein A2W80_12535 [Candidatus Riflebacteria bacterium GWC2_50_8]|nr:MAG: hypothetical protein A2W80_12535 [Candidatus Riflebacteria bacterium GWC2_50_8]
MVAIDELVQAYLKSPDEQDRKKAIGALFRIADREAVIALQQVAEIDESLEVRFYARRALAAVKSIRRPKAEEASAVTIPDPLDAEIFMSFDDEQKCSLLKALIDQNRSDSLKCLLAVMPTEQNPRVLATLVMAIGIFGTLLECRVLIPCLSHRDARVRANTIEALEMLGNLKLFAYIFPLLEDPDNRVRANAARSLKSIEPFTSFRLLQAMISSGKIAFQASAIFVLRCFESDASAALVAPFLDGPNEDLRHKAEQTLRLLADRGVERAVELVANLPVPAEEPSPGAMMQELSDQLESEPEGVSRLELAFTIQDPRERLEVIEKESVQLGEKAVEPLLGYLERESDQMVVGKIYILLGRLYDTRAIPCLLNGLRHADDRCRANAVEALGMIGEADSLNELVPFLEDSNNRVCGNAILALRSVGGIDINVPLQRLAESSEELYQRTAVYVLSELQRVEFFPLLQKLSRAAFPVVRKNAHTAINALKKAGYYFPDAEDESGQVPAAGEKGEMVDIIMHMAGKSGGKVRKEGVPGHHGGRPSLPHNAADSGQKRQNYIAIAAIVIILIPVIALLAKLAIDYNAELTVKAVAVESALAQAQDVIKRARTADGEISGVMSQIADAQAVFERESAVAVAAQKKLDKMRNAVKSASAFVTSVNEAFRSLQNAHRLIDKNCRDLGKIVSAARAAITEKPRPLTGMIDTSKIRAELEALALEKAGLEKAAAFIAKLTANLQRLQNDLPKSPEIEQEQAKFKKLSEVLPVADKPLAELDALATSILNESNQIGEAEVMLVKVSPRNQILTELAALKTSLFDGRARLQKCRESLVAVVKATEDMARNGSSPELVESLNKAVASIEAVAKPATLLPEIPDMLFKTQASIVRALTILHQKVLAEAVSSGIEADFTTNWDAVVSSETARVVALYANAHALNDRVTAEEVAGFSNIDLIDLDDELQAALVIVTNATAYLSNVGAFFDTVERPESN